MQTPVAGAVVLTVRYPDGTCETRIDGGRLDGWTLPARDVNEARDVHRGAVRLAREALAA